jgi:hypothetical protein
MPIDTLTLHLVTHDSHSHWLADCLALAKATARLALPAASRPPRSSLSRRSAGLVVSNTCTVRAYPVGMS